VNSFATIDIRDCNADSIRSKEKIQDYVLQLCKLMQLERIGDCQIVNFGEGKKEGFSMVQLLETSCMTAHFENEQNLAFINIFSCNDIDVYKVRDFSKEFFEGSEAVSLKQVRGFSN